jgi:hypothetical protein
LKRNRTPTIASPLDNNAATAEVCQSVDDQSFFACKDPKRLASATKSSVFVASAVPPTQHPRQMMNLRAFQYSQRTLHFASLPGLFLAEPKSLYKDCQSYSRQTLNRLSRCGFF